MTNQVALYGGSFDPVTLAHESSCEQVWDETGLEVWIMPCWEHKFDKKPSPGHHRWAMLQLLGQKFPFVKPFSWELDNHHSGSTYETLKVLQKHFPETQFHIIIGMDNANVILKWDKGDLLIQQFPFIVLTRKGEESKTSWYQKDPHRLIDVDCGISSTQVRNAISEGDHQKAQELVSPDVWKYILNNSLYEVHRANSHRNVS